MEKTRMRAVMVLICAISFPSAARDESAEQRTTIAYVSSLTARKCAGRITPRFAPATLYSFRSLTVFWEDEHLFPVIYGEKGSGLSFEITNTTKEILSINWDQSSLVDVAGFAHRIVHSGVKFSAANEPQAPSAVPPGAKFSDTVLPADSFEYSQGEWVKHIWLPSEKGRSRISLVLGISFNGKPGSLACPIDIDTTVEVKITGRLPLSGEACDEKVISCGGGLTCGPGGVCFAPPPSSSTSISSAKKDQPSGAQPEEPARTVVVPSR